MAAKRKRRKRTKTPLMTYTVKQFCDAHNISRATYYRLKEEGLAPAEMNLGRRLVVISYEAAADWRRARGGKAA